MSVVRVKILRCSPKDKRHRIDTFQVPYRPGMTIQTAIRYIYENRDPSLAFRDFRCGQGVCKTCCMKVNGRVLRSCETLIRQEQEVFVEPANDRIIKDLVVELD